MHPPRPLKLLAWLMRWTMRLLAGVALVLAALVAVLHWGIVPRINDFRPGVESRLSRVLEVPVRIGRLEADSSSGLVPALRAHDVRLLQPDDPDAAPGLQLDQVQVALSLRSLLALRAEQIVIRSPRLQVRREADGGIRVAGIPVLAAPGEGSNTAADWLFRQREIVIEGGQVTWTDAQRQLPSVDFSQVQLLLRNAGLRHEWQVSVTPPSAWGEQLVLRGRFRQPLLALHGGDMRRWTGQLFAEATRLDAAGMAPYLSEWVPLKQGQGSARIWLDIAEAQLKDGTVDLALRDVLAQWPTQRILKKSCSSPTPSSAKSYKNNSEQDSSAVDACVDAKSQAAWMPQEPLVLRSVQGRLGGATTDQGFRFFTEQLAVEMGDGRRWPGGRLRVEHAYPQGTEPSETDVELHSIDIAAVSALARGLPLPATLRRWLADYAPAGTVQQAAAHWRGDMDAPQDWRATLDVEQLAMGVSGTKDAKARPVSAAAQWGLQGLNATLEASAGGGKARIRMGQGGPGALYLPTVFEEAMLPLDQLDGEVRWTVAGDAIRVESDKFTFANADAAGQARFDWRTADEKRSSSGSRFPGVLDLSGQLSRAKGNRVHRYLPLEIPADARHYVRDAVVAGEAGPVQFQVKGDLHDVPFRKPDSGVFRISAQVRDVHYAYVPASVQAPGEKPWPVLSRLSGELLFDRASMEVRNAKGILDGNEKIRVEQAQARIADLEDTRVLVTAQARGPLPDMLATVKRSEIAALTEDAMSKAVTTGNAQLQLRLDLPVHRMRDAKVDGNVQLAGNDIHFHPDAPAVAAVSGAVHFSEKGFALQGVKGQALGGEVLLSGGMDASKPAADMLDVRAEGVATAQGLRQAALTPLTQLAQWADGQTRYALKLGAAHGQAQILVSSDMQGLAWRLPAPLAKPAAESWPLRFVQRFEGDAGERERIEVDLGARGAVSYVRSAGGAPRVLQGAIRVGDGPALPLPAQGVAARVRLPQLPVEDWLKVAEALAPSSPSAPAAQPSAAVEAPWMDYLPSRWDVDLGQLRYQTLEVNQLQLRGSRSGRRWTNQLSSSLADGTLEYQQESGGPGKIVARLAQLRVKADAPDVDVRAPQAPGKEPQRLPALDVVVDDLQWHGHAAGRLALQAVNQGPAARPWWHLTSFNIQNDDASLHASGDWGRPQAAATGPVPGDGPRRTQLEMRLELRDTGALLARLGMPGVVRQGKGQLTGTLGWMGSPFNPDYRSMDGHLNMDVGQGQFLKADPGLAKLLGVLSLQSLPRRLTLDFKDVFSSGFAFDFVRGDVKIAAGVASTNNLQMKGVSAAVLLEGKASLQNETQQLHVVVIPEINAMTASLVATAINPVIGLGSFLAQAFLRGPLMQAATQEFSVTGSWSNPEVERVARGSRKAGGGAADNPAVQPASPGSTP
ncbi:MAG: YhdP family protein [Comamonas sp.]